MPKVTRHPLVLPSPLAYVGVTIWSEKLQSQVKVTSVSGAFGPGKHLVLVKTIDT